MTLPDLIIPADTYYAELFAMAAEARGCFVLADDETFAIWAPEPVPSITSALLDLMGCLDADFTQ